MIRFSVTLLAYGAAILVVGVLTYMVAPPGAKASTAALVPSIAAILLTLCAVCAPLVRDRRRVGLLAIYGGCAIPVIVGLGAGMRLSSSLSTTQQFNAEFKRDGSIALVAAGEGKRHNTAYQTVGIGSTVTISAFAFVVLLMHFPRIPAARARTPESTAPPLTPTPAGTRSSSVIDDSDVL